MEQTLGIIKPEALKQAGNIERKIREAGLTIIHAATEKLSLEQCRDFYAHRKHDPSFEDLCTYMTQGRVRLVVLQGSGAIHGWKALLGPTEPVTARKEAPQSLRALYGADEMQNGLHGSDSFVSAEREIQFLFPHLRKDGSSGEAIRDYLASHITPTLTEALAQLSHERPDDPITWLADWLYEHA